MADKNKEVIEAFKLFDKDGDGSITQSEIKQLVTSLGGDYAKVKSQLNWEGDKSIDLKTFLTLWNNFKSSCDEDADEVLKAFKAYDVNNDGYISRDEIMKVINGLDFVGDKEKEALKCLQDLDLNNDGQISYAEFMIKWKI